MSNEPFFSAMNPLDNREAFFKDIQEIQDFINNLSVKIIAEITVRFFVHYPDEEIRNTWLGKRKTTKMHSEEVLVANLKPNTEFINLQLDLLKNINELIKKAVKIEDEEYHRGIVSRFIRKKLDLEEDHERFIRRAKELQLILENSKATNKATEVIEAQVVHREQ